MAKLARGALLSLLLCYQIPAAATHSDAQADQVVTATPGSSLRAEDARIAEVTYRVAIGAKGHCTATYPITGLALHHLADYHLNDRAQAASQFGLLQGPGIVAIASGSPAARSGLLAGDVLVSVNGVPFTSPAAIAAERDSKKRRKLVEQSEGQLEEQLRLGPVRLDVLRKGERVTIPLAPLAGCEVRGRLARSSQANAFADGRYAIMTTKLLGFIQDEDELAVAMTHEMAHNLLRHPARLDDEKVPHGILRNFGKNAARVRATEEEADRLGLKLLWSAGYNVNAAIPFWRRLYARYNPLPIPKLLRTHPSIGARERMITQMISELGASRTRR